MSLDNHFCVIKNKEFKLVASQKSDFPIESLCFHLLLSLKEMLEKNEINVFSKKIDLVKVATKTELDMVSNLANLDPDIYVKNHKLLDPSLCLMDVFEVVKNINIFELSYYSPYYIKSSQFCEWFYLLDLDKERFEIYRGNNKKNLLKGERFYFFQENDSEYKPVKYFFGMSFKNLKEEESVEGIIAILKDSEEIHIRNNT